MNNVVNPNPLSENQARQFSEMMREFLVGPKSAGGRERGINITPLHHEGGRHISEEDKTRVLTRVGELIGPTTITGAFKARISGLVVEQLESSKVSAVGPEFITDECGIHLDRGEFGIFDAEKAQSVERKALRAFVQNPPVPADDELVAQWSEKADIWEREYKEKYREDPFG